MGVTAPVYLAPASRLLEPGLTHAQRLEHLQDLITWMRTRSPSETYDYWDGSDCLLVRYMRARGIPVHTEQGCNYPAVSDAVLAKRGFLSHGERLRSGMGYRWTVGGALSLAEAALREAA